MKKNSANDLLYLGIFILFVGIALLSYSVVSYKEVKNLETHIDFEELENPKLSTTKKYDKHLIIADFLNGYLEKYKTLPVKSTVCIYLDYSQHNAISMYNVIYNTSHNEQFQRNNTLKYLKNLYSQYENYKTCKQYTSYHKELKNLIDKAEKSSEQELLKDSNLENFLYGKENTIEKYTNYGSNIPTDEDTTESIKRVEKMTPTKSIYEQIPEDGV